MKNIDNRLTILLTLKDREKFTFRWLEYVNKICLPFKIIIADGGKTSIIEKALLDKSTFPNILYEYYKYPFDSDISCFKKKLIDATSKIDSPFMMLTDNDDFIIVNGIIKSLNFMEKNPKYSCAKGRIGFVNVGAKNFKKNQLVYGDNNTYWIPKSLGVNLNSALERFELFLNVYSQPEYYSNFYYGINKTSEFVDVVKSTFKSNIEDIFLEELAISGQVAINGNIESGNYLYLVRQRNTPNTSSSTYRKKLGNEYDKMFRENWSYDFKKFVDIISKSVSTKENIKNKTIENRVVESYKKYIAPTIHNRISKGYREQLNIENSRLKSLIMKCFRKKIKEKFISINKSPYQDILHSVEDSLNNSY